jgi:hypothetical protein
MIYGVYKNIKIRPTEELLREIDAWVDFSDRDTWFCDKECTIRAYRHQDVNYVACKVTGAKNAYKVGGKMQLDRQGRYYVAFTLDN